MVQHRETEAWYGNRSQKWGHRMQCSEVKTWDNKKLDPLRSPGPLKKKKRVKGMQTWNLGKTRCSCNREHQRTVPSSAFRHSKRFDCNVNLQNEELNQGMTQNIQQSFQVSTTVRKKKPSISISVLLAENKGTPSTDIKLCQQSTCDSGGSPTDLGHRKARERMWHHWN